MNMDAPKNINLPEENVITKKDMVTADRDADFFDKINSEIYNSEAIMGSDEESALHGKLFLYLEEQIPKLDSFERGKFLLSQLDRNKDVEGIDDLKAKIWQGMAIAAENNDALEKIIKEAPPYAMNAKRIAIRKLIEINTDLGVLWKVALLTKDNKNEFGELRDMVVKKILDDPKLNKEQLTDLKVIITEEDGKDWREIERRITEMGNK